MAGVESSEETLSEEVQGELEVLRSIYQGDGEFSMEMCCNHGDDLTSSYVCEVIIKPADMMLGLSFSLPVSYPDTSPRIELVSLPYSTSHENVGVLLGQLYQVAKENAGMPHMYSVVEGAKRWLQDHLDDLQVEEASNSSESDWMSVADTDADSLKEKKNESKKNVKKQDPDEYGRVTKKPPMKTATDVISRIQWDDQLNPDHFIVGYLDRFIGIVEQPFGAFYWGDIAAVDHLTLAIPRHRIQYFKYKDEVVWDKRIRLDNVFGSLGSGLTVVDVVERYAKENRTEEEDGSEKEVDEGGDAEGEDEEGRVGGAVGGVQSRKRIDKSRPNYFIGIQITSDDIKSNVKKIQDHMSSIDPLVSSYLISLTHLHVTLCMLQLTSKAQINTALSVLKNIQSDLASMLLPVTMLRFHGVDTFHDRIVYSPPEADPALEKMTQFLKTSLIKAGISLTGTRDEFVPHLTIMKMPREGASGHPIFTSDLKSAFSDMHLGTQVVCAIKLCSIEEKPAEDKFYNTLARVDLIE